MRVGVRERTERQGRRMIVDFMPDQHREFYNQLPTLFLASVDESGQPWASVVVGKPGFVTSPSSRDLKVCASLLPHDPLANGLKQGAQLGLLGLEFHTRRRNRMNGVVAQANAEGFEIRVVQAFGNCPQYIQKRSMTWHERSTPEFKTGSAMNGEVKALMKSADTFFIATSYDEHGADMSHRGGKPGFVKVEDEHTFVTPDFRGNNHFNTIGNLLLNPKAGLLFLDFESGDILYLAVETEIVWEGPELKTFEGSQRLLRFKVSEWRLLKGAFPFTWDFIEYSPNLRLTGKWDSFSS